MTATHWSTRNWSYEFSMFLVRRWHLSKTNKFLVGRPDPLLQVMFNTVVSLPAKYLMFIPLGPIGVASATVPMTLPDIQNQDRKISHWKDIKKKYLGTKIMHPKSKIPKSDHIQIQNSQQLCLDDLFWSWGPEDIFARPRRGTVQWTFLSVRLTGWFHRA